MESSQHFRKLALNMMLGDRSIFFVYPSEIRASDVWRLLHLYLRLSLNVSMHRACGACHHGDLTRKDFWAKAALKAFSRSNDLTTFHSHSILYPRPYPTPFHIHL